MDPYGQSPAIMEYAIVANIHFFAYFGKRPPFAPEIV